MHFVFKNQKTEKYLLYRKGLTLFSIRILTTHEPLRGIHRIIWKSWFWTRNQPSARYVFKGLSRKIKKFHLKLCISHISLYESEVVTCQAEVILTEIEVLLERSEKCVYDVTCSSSFRKTKKRIIITILTCFLHASIASMRHSDGGKVSLVSSSFLFINLGRFFNSPGQVVPTWNHAILTDWNKYEDTRQSTISVQNVAISI